MKHDKTIALLLFIFLATIGLGYYLSRYGKLFTQTGKRAAGSLSVETHNLSTHSQIRQDQDTVVFYLSQKNSSTGLFQTTIASVADALTFSSARPLYEGNLNVLTPQSNESQVLIPQTPFTLSVVAEKVDEVQKRHYYFTQTQCGGVPVFASYLSFHSNEEGQLYALDGNMVKNSVNCDRVFTPSQVVNAARKQAETEPEMRPLQTSEVVAEYIFNSYLAGISESSENHLVYIVNICSVSRFCRSYFVSEKTGEIVFSHNMSVDALNRDVSAGSSRRTEGQAPVSSAVANKGYDILGETYNYYMNNHQRDSFNERGARIRLNISCSATQAAMWDGVQMYACDGFVTNDVLAHEFTHGVTQYAVGGSQGLIYENEPGGLNESLSDIFGSEVDSGDWTMGEDSRVGAIRDLANPPRFRQPDSLYNPLYLCSGDQKAIVHTNSGVFNKAYYLMAQGGTHNNCTVTGVGRQKASATVYKAVTTYLRGKSSANSRDMYNAVTQACSDLYGATSTECANITAALQSTHMDKQPLGSALGVGCGTRRPTGTPLPAATCAGTTGESPTPGEGTTPTGVQITGTPVPTEGSLTPTLTPTPSPEENFVELNMRLKFQGITRRSPKRMLVWVRLIGDDIDKPVSSFGYFDSNDDGIWTGKVTFVDPSEIEGGKNLALLVKGEKHAQKRICESRPTEKDQGTYSCSGAVFSLKPGVNELDFTGVTILAGDTKPQDGVINALDIARVRNNLNSTDPKIVDSADLNYDGVINAVDDSLIIAALRVRTDEK